jgi:hypothetical protein
MNEDGMEQYLQNYFQAEVKTTVPPAEWWDGQIAKLPVRGRARRAWFVPRTKLAWILLPLLLALIGGTVYGGSTAMRSLFQQLAGHIEQKGLVQEMSVSQTIDGVTVGIQRAYADSNVILLGTMVSGPKKDYNLFVGELTTEDGYEFPGMTAFGTGPGSKAIPGEWSPNEREAVLASYDASKLEGAPAELHLKLTINVTERGLFGQDGKTTGPFVLSFTLPLNSGEVIDVNQTVEANGIPVTLKKVLISPWVTQVELQFQDTTHPVAIMNLETPEGKEVIPFMTSQSSTYFLGDYTNEHGDYKMTITELMGKPGTGSGPNKDRIAGPWVFHFKIP